MWMRWLERPQDAGADWKLEAGSRRSQNHMHFGLEGLVMSM